MYSNQQTLEDSFHCTISHFMKQLLTCLCIALYFIRRFCYQFQVTAILATLTAFSLATPVSVLDHYSPLGVAVSHPAVAIAQHVPVAQHETVEVEHYVSAAVGSVESPY
jgi:hypothetical protein